MLSFSVVTLAGSALLSLLHLPQDAIRWVALVALAAIVIAGATGTIGLPTVVLTLSFAVGAALPLLFFALAGRRVAERVAAFRRKQR